MTPVHGDRERPSGYELYSFSKLDNRFRDLRETQPVQIPNFYLFLFNDSGCCESLNVNYGTRTENTPSILWGGIEQNENL